MIKEGGLEQSWQTMQLEEERVTDTRKREIFKEGLICSNFIGRYL
jgi:hypothetical protein